MILLRIDQWLKKPVALVSLLLIHLLLGVICAQSRSVNGDEHDYYIYAVRTMKGHPERIAKLDDSKSVLAFPAIIPRAVFQVLHPSYKAADWGMSDMRTGRYMMLIYAVFLVIFLWSLLKKLDLPYAMLALPFVIIDPLLINYGIAIITDLASGFFTIAMMYYAWQFYTTKRHIYLLAFSVAMGLGIVCKFSFAPVIISFLPGCLLCVIKRLKDRRFVIFLIKSIATASLYALCAINICYPTDKRLVPLSKMELKSEKFRQLSGGFMGKVPIPVPLNMVQAADLLSYHAQSNLPAKDVTCLEGVWVLNAFRKIPVWYFYWVILIIKTPIFLLLLWLAGTVLAITSYRRHKFVLLCVGMFLFFCIYSGLFNPFQSGIRHLLPVYPLMFIIAGFALYRISLWTSYKAFRMIWYTGLAWALISVGYYFPTLFAYTNEFITDKKTAYRCVGEGVIDYAEAIDFRNQFVKDHPEYQLVGTDCKKAHCKYVATVSDLYWSAFEKNNAKAMELWNRRPDRAERFVLLIFE